MLRVEDYGGTSKMFVYISVKSKKPFDVHDSLFPARALRKAILDFNGAMSNLVYCYHTPGLQNLVVYDDINFLRDGGASDRLRATSGDEDPLVEEARRIRDRVREIRHADLQMVTKGLKKQALTEKMAELSSIPTIEIPQRTLRTYEACGLFRSRIEVNGRGHILEVINIHNALEGLPLKKYFIGFF